MADQHTEDLEQLRDQLRAEIRQARETLKDLRYEIRTARELVPLLTDELFEAEVAKQLKTLGEETEKAMDSSVDRVNKKFDELYNLLTAQDRHSRRAGKPSIPELLRAKHTIETARDQP